MTFRLRCYFIQTHRYPKKNTPEIFRREYKVFGVNEWRLAARYGTTEAVDTLVKLIRSGDIKLKEHITDGLENAAAAFAELLTGGNTGKAVVVVSE
jgi:NADPH-dependent curcumin reductase CurA